MLNSTSFLLKKNILETKKGKGELKTRIILFSNSNVRNTTMQKETT